MLTWVNCLTFKLEPVLTCYMYNGATEDLGRLLLVCLLNSSAADPRTSCFFLTRGWQVGRTPSPRSKDLTWKPLCSQCSTCQFCPIGSHFQRDLWSGVARGRQQCSTLWEHGISRHCNCWMFHIRGKRQELEGHSDLSNDKR